MVLFLDHYRGIHVKHGSHSHRRANGKSLNMYFKGQIISEWIYEIINFPKNDPKNLKDFCPMYCKNSQGRNPLNFLGLFGSIQMKI